MCVMSAGERLISATTSISERARFVMIKCFRRVDERALVSPRETSWCCVLKSVAAVESIRHSAPKAYVMVKRQENQMPYFQKWLAIENEPKPNMTRKTLIFGMMGSMETSTCREH